MSDVTLEKPPSRKTALRTRIAPSPTGRMHAGNLFAALCAWLIARRGGGQVLLRIEDLDRQRSREEHASQIMRDLEWLGIGWDGPVMRQSARDGEYEAALGRLEDLGLCYPCFCTRAQVNEASAPHEDDAAPIYPGTCRMLSDDERCRRLERERASVRLAVPYAGDKAGEVRFHDELQGDVSADLAKLCGDFLIRRRDGLFAYQLAVSVDDLEQGVNCLVRGCDLLPSVPQQLYIRSLLADEDASLLAGQMRFYHVPLFTDGLGRRLSKRNRDADLGVLRESLKTPEAIFGRIAGASQLIAGWDGSPISLEEMLEAFNLDALKLKWAVLWE